MLLCPAPDLDLQSWRALVAGVELLLLILKSKRRTRTSALKCLDFATTRCPPACDRVVDQQGLRTLFAIFLGKLKVCLRHRALAVLVAARAPELSFQPAWPPKLVVHTIGKNDVDCLSDCSSTLMAPSNGVLLYY